MRAGVVMAVAALVGVAAGVGSSWAKLGSRPDFTDDFNVLTSVVRQSNEPRPVVGPQSRVVVDSDEHDFGTIERGHTVEYAFRFRNEGQAPLTLKSGGTSCGKCTISKIPTARIMPGTSADVVVEYNASIDGAQFRQSATILTNDPLTPRVSLSVLGKVSASYELNPGTLVFSKLAAGEAKTAEVKFVSYLADTFKIESSDFTDPDTAAFFDAQITPLAADELPAEAKCGFKIAVTVKPGLPLGPVRQKLWLLTDIEGARELEIPIEGSIDSDITIAGQGWERAHGVLQLGAISSAQGTKRELLLLIRGPQRHDVEISVGKCEPSFLEASVGEPTNFNGGAVVRRTLVVQIPPGAPDSDNLRKWGYVTLETTHSDAKQVRVYVQFAVEH